jgi:hypothetical protein
MTYKMSKHVCYNKDTKCCSWTICNKNICHIFIKEEDGKMVMTQFLGAFTALSRPC